MADEILTENNNIFQIFISDDGVIPDKIARCIETVRAFGKLHSHHLFDGERLRAFIAAEYPAEVLAAYDKLIPYAFKSDLGRLCLLHRYGGWYLDITLTLRGNLPRVEGFHHVLFKDSPIPGRQPWLIASGMIFAIAGSPIMATAIESIVENCRTQYYGTGPLDLAGPGVLGRAAALHGPERRNIQGMFMALTPLHKRPNYAFVMPDGQILAWGKESAGTHAGNGLGDLGVTGGNSYTDLYNRREVYRPADAM